MDKIDKWRPLQEGERVTSEIITVGPLPESFKALGPESGNDWSIGVGLIIDGDAVTIDPDLQRYFASLGAPAFDLKKIETPQQQAIKDIVDQIVADYRKSDIYRNNIDEQHQLYGEISRRIVGPKDAANVSEYDDVLPHIDFVPPETPCRGYFLADQYPTEFLEGEFTYGGNLVTDYSDPKWGLSHKDKKMYPSGNLYATPDARTLIHQASFPTPGTRTFGRFFGDIKR